MRAAQRQRTISARDIVKFYESHDFKVELDRSWRGGFVRTPEPPGYGPVTNCQNRGRGNSTFVPIFRHPQLVSWLGLLVLCFRHKYQDIYGREVRKRSSCSPEGRGFECVVTTAISRVVFVFVCQPMFPIVTHWIALEIASKIYHKKVCNIDWLTQGCLVEWHENKQKVLLNCLETHITEFW